MTPRTLWLGFIKRTLNRVTSRLAKAGVGQFWLIHHVGRKSGREFATPIIVARAGDEFVIELTYGPGVQWHRNLVAAGGAVLEHGGRRWEVTGPEAIPLEHGLAAFTPPQQRVLRLLRREHFEVLRPTGRTWRRVRG
jgi:deazaflavin-dependent oxidoreductase (nitroreductase family)